MKSASSSAATAASPPLAATSVSNYEWRLQRLAKHTGRSADQMALDPKATMAAIRELYSELQSQRAMINAFLSFFKHGTADLRKRQRAKLALWKQLFQDVNAKVMERYENNEPSERQREAYMALDEVLRIRDALPKDSDAYLVLCLYTMIPTLRADFGHVRILQAEPPSVQKDQGNYLVVPGAAPMRLVLNEFKSKSKKLSQYSKELPKELADVVRASLARRPRAYLLVSPRSGEPFVKDNTYVVWVNRLLRRVLGKPIGISMLRHIYVNGQDYNRMTSREKKELSRDMLHSESTNDRYRLIFDAKSSKLPTAVAAAGMPPGTQVHCDCTTVLPR